MMNNVANNFNIITIYVSYMYNYFDSQQSLFSKFVSDL